MNASPAVRAVDLYMRELNVPGWSVAFGQVRDDAGDTVVPTVFRKGELTVHYDAYVWGPDRVGEMDPETAASIAAAVAGERLCTGTGRKVHAKPSATRPGPRVTTIAVPSRRDREPADTPSRVPGRG
jgi:hypothetical protein